LSHARVKTRNLRPRSQGSNLGPLLFLIYINDLANAISSVPRLFADDTCIHASCSNAKKLKNGIKIELKLIHNWSLANKMYMNLCKPTASILFSNKNKQADMKLLMNNSKLNVTNACKYLGMIMLITSLTLIFIYKP